jgi:leucyl/phenylalanyl-tRNA--protein transferase
MAYSAGSPYVHWICPDMRGQLSITDMHIPKRLAKTIRGAPFEIRVDADFEGVIRGCAEKTPTRPETWINEQILKAYMVMHERGHAHSVECWKDGALVGGIYGVELGGAFFGESMFSRSRDASKVALVHLIARLWRGGFTLFDTQFINDHLAQVGVYETPHAEFKRQLEAVCAAEADFRQAGISQQQIIGEYMAFRKKSI